MELLDEDVHCGEPGVDYETTGEPDESGAAEEPGTDDGDFGNDDAFGDDYDTGRRTGPGGDRFLTWT